MPVPVILPSTQTKKDKSVAIPIPDLNLNITQTPISGISGASSTTTGAFFSGGYTQPQQSPNDLVTASVGTGNIENLLMTVGAGLLGLVVLRKVL